MLLGARSAGGTAICLPYETYYSGARHSINKINNIYNKLDDKKSKEEKKIGKGGQE